MESKICLIIPYFGRFPEYFNFWLKSCEYNRCINWLLITNNIVDNPPDNVQVINMQFDDLRKRIQKCFDFSISLDSYYKLCDFKPCYGLVFREELKGYDFWGHCDMDLIWGNFTKFINDDILSKYDRFFTRGHLVIYRNTDEVCNWFRTLELPGGYDYKQILSSSKSFAFDESGGKTSWGGMTRAVKNNNKKQYYNICFDDVNFTYRHFYIKKKIIGLDTLPIDKIKKYPSFYTFNEGTLVKKIFINNDIYINESLYVHFQKRTFSVFTSNTSKYNIVPNKFLPIEVDLHTLRKLSRVHLIRYSYYFSCLKKKIKNIFK